MNLRELQRNWDSMGRRNPFTVILTARMRWDAYDFFRTGEAEIEGLIEDVKSLNHGFGGERALDFGCGVGRLTQPLADYYDEAYGVDIAPSMIEAANTLNRRGEGCRYILNERDDLRIFMDDYFDLIYSNITLQHMKPLYSLRYIEELLRVLKSGGLLVFHLPSEKARKDLKDYLPAWAHTLIQQMLFGGAMEMHGVDRDFLVEYMGKLGGRTLLVKTSDSAGESWDAYQYFVTK